MKPSVVTTPFKNIQGFGDISIGVFPGTSILNVIRTISLQTSFNINQLDIITVTLKPGDPIEALPLKSIFPSMQVIQSNIYYYFVKPVRKGQQFVKVNDDSIPISIVTPPNPVTGKPTPRPSFRAHHLMSQFGSSTSRRFPSIVRKKTRPKEPPGVVFSKPKKSPEILKAPVSPPLGKTVKGKEKVKSRPAPLPSPMSPEFGMIKPVLISGPMLANTTPDIWKHPTFMQKLQLLSKTEEHLLSGKQYSSAEAWVYYHTDQEKQMVLGLLGLPDSVESSSVSEGHDSEVRYYLTLSNELIIPLAIRFIKTTGSESGDPILYIKGLPNYLKNVIKISISPDNNASQLAPLDYSSSHNLYNSILWLMVNHPGLVFIAPDPGPSSYDLSPPGSSSGSSSGDPPNIVKIQPIKLIPLP
uniref:Uncharacterized protein n=1 Tax=Pithovirus LCPAC202 TaxID=2506592 RepID=A0A481Z6L8_9VIRU|nr:MAG: hypothetical protein LCPAC202_02300 [Pithovirus LCPAC202]